MIRSGEDPDDDRRNINARWDVTTGIKYPKQPRLSAVTAGGTDELKNDNVGSVSISQRMSSTGGKDGARDPAVLTKAQHARRTQRLTRTRPTLLERESRFTSELRARKLLERQVAEQKAALGRVQRAEQRRARFNAPAIDVMTTRKHAAPPLRSIDFATEYSVDALQRFVEAQQDETKQQLPASFQQCVQENKTLLSLGDAAAATARLSVPATAADAAAAANATARSQQTRRRRRRSSDAVVHRFEHRGVWSPLSIPSSDSKEQGGVVEYAWSCCMAFRKNSRGCTRQVVSRKDTWQVGSIVI
jgi:hypothetical protein